MKCLITTRLVLFTKQDKQEFDPPGWGKIIQSTSNYYSRAIDSSNRKWHHCFPVEENITLKLTIDIVTFPYLRWKTVATSKVRLKK